MFRVQKSDGLTEHREGERDAADVNATEDEQGGSMTSSAFRWLRGPGKPDENLSTPRRRLAGAAALARAKSAEQENDKDSDFSDNADELELTEELELTMPLEAETPPADSAAQPLTPAQPPVQAIRSARASPAAISLQSVAAKFAPGEDPLPLGAFDDDDDIDDFDDLGDLEHKLPPARFEPAPRLSTIDLGNLDQQRNIVPPPAASTAPTVEPQSQPFQTTEQQLPSNHDAIAASLSSDSDRATIEVATNVDEKTGPEAVNLSRPKAEREMPIIDAGSDDPQPIPDPTPTAASASDSGAHLDDLPRITLRKATLEQHVPTETLDATKAKTGPTGLALQPIPELQSGLRPSIDKTSAQEAHAIEETQPAKAEATKPDVDEVLELVATDPIDEPAVPLPEAPPVPFGHLELLPEDADDDFPISEGRPASLDWHADLADVLSTSDSDVPVLTEATDVVRPTAQAVVPKMPEFVSHDRQPADELLESPPTPNPSTDLDVWQAPSQEGDGEDVLVPPLSTKHQDRSAIPTPTSSVPAAVVPVLPTTLSPEQIALAVITQVPRLRRFAAAQIGNEQEADHLVGTTVQSVLADPTVLAQAEDQSLTMLMLLCRRRQSDVSGAARSIRTASSAKAFLSTLCEKLIGADQFEIHQFAESITLIDEEDRTLLLLATLEGLSYEQIATMVQRPVGQVMLRLAEARMGLRLALTADEGKDQASSDAHAREIEIHGYLDGELDQRHMADMDSLVEHDQDAADRLLHYGIQGDLIRRLYTPLLNRPIPHELLAALSMAFNARPNAPVKRGLFRSARLALFAGVLIMAISTGIVTWVMPSLASAVTNAMTVSSLTPVRSTDSNNKQQRLAATTAFGR